MSRRGMTLIECVVAMVVSLALVAAVDAALLAGQRMSRADEASRGLRQNLRAAASVLRAELEVLAPEAGDLARISDSAVTLRALRIAGIVCGTQPGGVLVLDDSLLSQLRAADPSKDSVLVFNEGDPLASTDDRWIAGQLTQVRRGACASGGGGTVITIAAAPADLAGIAIGAPVRIFETDEYRRYRDATNLWWLGVRTSSGTGWSAMSPIAGPLSNVGLRFDWYDAALGPTTIPDSVALVEVALRLLDQRALRAAGKVQAQSADSARIRIAFTSR